LCFVILLFFVGIFPGLMPSTTAGIAGLGIAKCIRNSPGLFHLLCSNAGYPYGAPSTFGLPLHALIANLSGVFHLSIRNAYYLSYALYLGLAFLGCVKLLHRLTANYWLALIGTFLFLASPIVSSEGGYGALLIGFALLPTYVYINLLAIDRFTVEKTPYHTALAWLAILVASHTFAMFFDGYSFVMALLVAGLFWAIWSYEMLKLRRFRQICLGSAVALASVAFAIEIYRIYIPQSQYPTEPLAFFRGQGIDLYMFAVPSVVNWFAATLGWHHSITGYQVYSDGPSSSIVYLGYSFLVCSLVCAWLTLKNKVPERRILAGLLIAGLIAMILSIGPALKWHNLREASGPTTYNNYLMPEGKATIELGTGWLYEHVPGINNMRALYRWQLIVRLAMIAAAMVVLALLIARKKWALTVIIALALTAETLPSLSSAVSAESRADRTITQFDTQAASALRTIVVPHSKILFLQLHSNASYNEYLTTFLCADAKVYCYNVGGDKNMVLASDAWPAPIFEIISNRNVALNVSDAFRYHLVDEIVVPFFDLRTQAYSWPPVGFPRTDVINKLKAQYSEYEVHIGQWYATIKPKMGYVETDNGRDLEDYIEGNVATVAQWGPKTIDSKSRKLTYIWVKTSDAPTAVSVAVGNHILATLQNSKDLLAAPVRTPADRTVLDSPNTYPVYLINRDTHTKQQLGSLTINK
jgi:hypothetical protein